MNTSDGDRSHYREDTPAIRQCLFSEIFPSHPAENPMIIPCEAFRSELSATNAFRYPDLEWDFRLKVRLFLCLGIVALKVQTIRHAACQRSAPLYAPAVDLFKPSMVCICMFSITPADTLYKSSSCAVERGVHQCLWPQIRPGIPGCGVGYLEVKGLPP
jgi:hypothetical protein